MSTRCREGECTRYQLGGKINQSLYWIMSVSERQGKFGNFLKFYIGLDKMGLFHSSSLGIWRSIQFWRTCSLSLKWPYSIIFYYLSYCNTSRKHPEIDLEVLWREWSTVLWEHWCGQPWNLCCIEGNGPRTKRESMSGTLLYPI
jgi:hypothetical protein